MELPEILQAHTLSSQKLLKSKAVEKIEFAGSTYQVKVRDPSQEGEAAWAFLQLDEAGQLRDCFCSCDQTDDASTCPHLAAAFLALHDAKGMPLHKRFEISLWNKLCQIYAEANGYDTAVITPSEAGRYTCGSLGKKSFFSIQGKTAESEQQLEKLFFDRSIETEETSLKFSNLSQEELTLWREGTPSSQLRYDLSFWSDLARLLMELQSRSNPYSISFSYSPKGLPNQIKVFFESLELSFYLSETNLIDIIPSLNTVESPLKAFFTSQTLIGKITYDASEGVMHLLPSGGKVSKKQRPEASEAAGEGIILEGWRFVSGLGFFERSSHALLGHRSLSGKEINAMLNEHFEVVQERLDGANLYRFSVFVSYHITFDSDWNLIISSYLFTPGDLSTETSRVFGDWVYLSGDGFYRLEGRRFDSAEIIVPKGEVATFVRDNRIWFNEQPGFHTHMGNIEAQFSYELSQDNRLSFSRKISFEDAEGGRACDFGGWIYFEGKGFYARSTAPMALPIREGITLNSDQIPIFIRMNRDELQLVPHFFSSQCPIAKAGLVVTLSEDETTVIVTPQYTLHPEYAEKDLRYFDDFVYVAKEGFHELPPSIRLPERFRQQLQFDQESFPLFLNFELDVIQHHLVKIDPRLIKPNSMRLVAGKITKQETQGKHWYGLKLAYHSDQGSVPLSKLWTAKKEQRRYLFTDAGLIDLEERRFNWVGLVAKDRIDRRANMLALTTLELIRLNALDSISVQEQGGKSKEESSQLLDELAQFRVPEPPDITGLSCALRPYQHLGLEWLWFLYKHQLSGLLCDDMGLGKTHQTMALFAAVVNDRIKEGKPPGHFLIICPTSVIYHWQEKLQQFLPNLRLSTFYGSSRTLEGFEGQYNILLTSYGVWRMESELLERIHFEVAVFDEIQIAKNYASRVHASLLGVGATMRLGLTGTPIENHLRELKALFDITLPTYMLSESEYREFFIKPIERDGNAERKALLSQLIRPFVMRRKKEEVLDDLPEKIEEIVHCDLLPDQRILYQEVLARSRTHLLKELRNLKNPIPYVHIFALLTSLKQICDHPACYLKKPEEYKSYASGKWELFIEIIREARESEQKIVVFSQYLHMLDIIEMYLQEQGIGFAAIRGSTKDRASQLQRFNSDPTCEVFVASLQAAGLGVDLTAASVVVHYDRWWNAAREDQATDRVHRIGQRRGVQVLKPVTKNTFEERIDIIIASKAGLMDEVIGSDDHHVVKQFDRNEIIELLQLVDVEIQGAPSHQALPADEG